MSDVKVVVFDIDGVITPHISWQYFSDALGVKEEELELFGRLGAGQISLRDAERELVQLWSKNGEQPVTRQEMERVFKGMPLREGAEDLVAHLKRKGHEVVLITGSMDLYARVVAARLGVEHYYANTQLEWNIDDHLVDLHYEMDQSTKKVDQLNDFLAWKDIDPKDCAVVGDSNNDLKLFQAAGQSVFMESGIHDEELREHATNTINNLTHLKTLL